MTATSTAETNMALVRQALDAINRGDLVGLAATVTPDFTRNDLGRGFVLEGTGSDPLTTFIATVRAAMPDFAMHIDEIFGTEERVAAQIRLTGTHLGPFMGAPPSGRAITVNGVSLYRFRDGRICQNNQLLDMAGLVRELTGGGASAQGDGAREAVPA